MTVNGKRYPVWAPLYPEHVGTSRDPVYGLALQWQAQKRMAEQSLPEVRGWTLQQFIDRTMDALKKR